MQPTSAEKTGQAERASGGASGAESGDAALLDAITGAAAAAARGIAARSGQRAHLDVRAKAASDFVSEVDIEAETLIRTLLAARFPGAHLMGEELAPGAPPARGLTFVIDPLDGTTNFLHGYPEYAVSIAAAVDGELAAGVVHNVATGEVFTARRGAGAFRNGEPMSVSAVDDPQRALIGTGFPFRAVDVLADYVHQFHAVARATAGIRRAGSAALDLADVACGRFDAFWEPLLSPWDFAAGALLVREAGGIATDLAGGPIALARGSILAGNPALHRWLLDLLSSLPRQTR
ncbi:MAG TPA: inositol monophosphatase family protein [Gemmatimonadaceae bacterium]|nr:inositol monophosphatase family protein [Gemmatimonadaceae bacterium]